MRKVLIIFLILISTGCSILRKQQTISETELKSKVIKQIERFHEFKASGLLNLNLKSLEWKSNFVLFKKNNSLRLDIMEGGLLGLSPTPRAQILNNDSLRIFVPERKIIYTAPALKFFPQMIEEKINRSEVLKDRNDNYSLKISNQFELILNRDLYIEKILYDKLSIILQNYANNTPDLIKVFHKKDLIMELNLDEWHFREIPLNIFSIDIPGSTKRVKLDLKKLL